MALLAAVTPWHGSAQYVDGSTGHTLAGAALGVYSGATFGLLGSMFPCNRAGDGRRCVVSAASVGGALGIAMGGMIGSQNTEALGSRFRAAGLGVGVGGVAGVVVSQWVHQYGWQDAAALAVVGGAIGAAPYGAMLGLGAGVVAGVVVWGLVPDAGVQDWVVVSLVGLAVGGMVDWADGAAHRERTGYVISFSFQP